MNEPYTIDIIDDEFYSTHFSLSSKAFEERIYLYAECSKNPDFRKQDDYYFLELFSPSAAMGRGNFWSGSILVKPRWIKKRSIIESALILKLNLTTTFPPLFSSI